MKPTIVSEEVWTSARKLLLEEEKLFSKMRDQLNQKRRELPWHPVREDYVFEGPEGKVALSELFAGASQLIVYHYMFGPDWTEGCKSCSFWADQYDAVNKHIHARDVRLAVVSRAPLSAFSSFKQRMGWQFDWFSSFGSQFNEDYGVSFPSQKRGTYNYRETAVGEEMPGVSVFAQTAEGIFHTYSAYARGLDPLNATYQMLDLVPKGRDEADLPYGMAWVQFADRYQGTSD